jgi:hypothetical protein
VQALKAGRCATGGCSGAGRTQLRFQMLDSFGDGWNMVPDCTDPSNGCNVYTVSTVDTVDVVTDVTGTLEYSPSLESFSGEVNMCVDSATTKCVQIHVGAEGTYPEEISWTVKNAETGATMTPRSSMSANTYYRYDTSPANGVDDCTAAPTPARRFRCYNEETITWAQVCDGTPDCRSGEDEAPTLGAFCPHKDTCNVLNPEMIGNGWCDDAEDPETNTQGCGYDGGDCQCLRDYNNIKNDCSFPTVGTGASAVRGDAPPSGRCVDYGTCASGRTFTTNGVTTVVPGFSDFTNDCWTMHTPAVYRALTEFSFTCSPTFTCSNGDRILETNKCNGWKDCADGSDEGFTMCADQYQFGVVDRSFRCIDGSLKDQALECNGVCNCGNSAHGMCEDEHPIRGDTTCAAQECARRHASVLEVCADAWPASMNAEGVQKATCSPMCAPLVVALFTDASCTSHLPTGVTAAGAADAVRLCQHVIDNRAQPAFLCRDSSQTTVPIGRSQICDEVNDCGGAEDEAGHTPKCPYIIEAEAAAAGVTPTINDCAGNPQDPALLRNDVCDEIDGVQIFNCDGLGSGLDFDAGACNVEVTAEASMEVSGDVDCSQFTAAVASASPLVNADSVSCTAYTQTVEASIELGGLTPAMLDATTPAGAAAAEQVRMGLCTLLNLPEPCGIVLGSGAKGRRRTQDGNHSYEYANSSDHRRMQASSTAVDYTVTSEEPVSSTMSGDGFGSDAADAINSGGNALPAIDPSDVSGDVGAVTSDIDFTITVESDSLGASADGSAPQSTADVGAALGTELTASLDDTTAMRAALVAGGADICASCRMSTETSAVQTSEVQTASTSTGPPPAPPPAPVTGRCSGNTDASENVACGSGQELKSGASSIVGNSQATCCQEATIGGLTEEQAVAAAAAGGALLLILLCCCCIVVVLLLVVLKKKKAAAAGAMVKQGGGDLETAAAAVPAGLEQWDTNGDGVLDASELQAMAGAASVGAAAAPPPASPKLLPPIAAVPVLAADDPTTLFIAHLTEQGVKGNQEAYVTTLMEEGFDTPELFDSLSLEELENDFGFKRGHLRAVEAYRKENANQVVQSQGP